MQTPASTSSRAPWIPSAQSEQIAWGESLPFFGFHLLALAGVCHVGVRMDWVAISALAYGVRMFGITAGFHRYLSHRSYQFGTHGVLGRLGRVSRFLLIWIGTSSFQKGPLWWAAHHRLHHKHSDQENDIHSPKQRGFWWSHVGWILCRKYNETRWDQIQDLARFPELVWLNRHPQLPGVVLGAGLFAWGGLGALVWGLGVSTVLLWHGTFFINSLAHVVGTRRYETPDTSRNHWLLALITLGEGWHNNHHCYMSSTRQGFFWWEVDPTYSVLKALSWLGITQGLREPPLAALEAKRIAPERIAPKRIGSSGTAEHPKGPSQKSETVPGQESLEAGPSHYDLAFGRHDLAFGRQTSVS